MTRIRTVKPEFFRHEALQDLEIANPGKYPMMVFEALWGHCDSKGRFEWKPRMLKLDILPFLAFDMAETLSILDAGGMVRRYSVGGKEYGEVPTFEKHQRLSGKELTEGEKFPEPEEMICEATGKQRGSVGEIPNVQEGNGREEEGKGCCAALPENFPSNSISCADAPEPKPAAPSKAETALQAACRSTWDAYSIAYSERYGTGPVRNSKVSTQVKQFVQRLGFDEAPLVAAFYVGHANAFYVKKSHDFGSLLASCEGIRTEWATGRMVTATSAQQTDRTQSNFNSANEAIRILEARGATA